LTVFANVFRRVRRDRAALFWERWGLRGLQPGYRTNTDLGSTAQEMSRVCRSV